MVHKIQQKMEVPEIHFLCHLRQDTHALEFRYNVSELLKTKAVYPSHVMRTANTVSHSYQIKCGNHKVIVTFKRNQEESPCKKKIK